MSHVNGDKRRDESREETRRSTQDRGSPDVSDGAVLVCEESRLDARGSCSLGVVLAGNRHYCRSLRFPQRGPPKKSDRMIRICGRDCRQTQPPPFFLQFFYSLARERNMVQWYQSRAGQSSSKTTVLNPLRPGQRNFSCLSSRIRTRRIDQAGIISGGPRRKTSITAMII